MAVTKKESYLKTMINSDKEKGQTLIETVFVIMLLLILIFGIAEFARGWYVKNSLNNAARIGARFAAVEPDLQIDDPDVRDKVLFQSPGVPRAGVPANSDVAVRINGDTVTVTVTASYADGFSVFGTLIPGLADITELSSSAAMRYEQ